MFKFIVLVNLVTAVLAQTEPTTNCYSGGASPAASCNQFITNFCTDVAKNQYTTNNAGSACYNLPNGNRCDFVAFNSRRVSAAPSAATCQKVLQNITGQCTYGGLGQNGPNTYTFVVDPNTGRCVAGVQGGS